MNIIKLSIEKPIAVVSVVIMVILFGWVSLERIPIQMSPDVRQPIINITTNWPGAAPVEVEKEIIKVQEDVLRGLKGVVKITSTSRSNQGSIQLNFKIGSDMNQALLLISNRLDLIREYPEDAQQPFLSTSGSEDNSIAWFSLQPLKKDDKSSMVSRSELVNDIIKDKLERVDGVSSLRRSVLPDHKKDFNVGSFFKNLILEKSDFINLNKIINVPYHETNLKYKIPSGFLIEKAGWKGKGLNNIKVSQKHALVLITNGNQEGKEIIQFAQSIIDDVYKKFKVKLEIEPTLI